MKSSASATEPRAVELKIGRDALTLHLDDGRVVSVPLEFYPTLVKASAQQRRNWRWVGPPGHGVHWPDLDLDLEFEGIVMGVRERVFPAEVRRKWQQDARDLAKQRRQTKRHKSEQQV
jgi:hypothetical protein